MQHKYFEPTAEIVNLSTDIGHLLGVIDGSQLRKPQPTLRKRNKIKTIRASLAIEGNTLTEAQVTAILDNKPVIGPQKDILEVRNAIKAYESLPDFNPYAELDYLRAHQILMEGLVDKAGQYRTEGVGVFQGSQVAHLAPPAWNVPHLMSQLFAYLLSGTENLIIKSCIFHYEMEFIHPFSDGNGRMGRLWQTRLLMEANPVFEFLPVEEAIKDSQEDYYKALSDSDRSGLSTTFVVYALKKIRSSLQEMIKLSTPPANAEERIQYFMEQHDQPFFTRKDYRAVFPNLSTSTASRDLQAAVQQGLLLKTGDKRNTTYERR